MDEPSCSKINSTDTISINNNHKTSKNKISDVKIPSILWKFLLLTCILSQILNFHLCNAERHKRGPNTTYISQVLNRLTDRNKYDKRLRPQYGEGPVDVGITIHVSSISAVSEVDMDFTLDFYLRQTWYDPRLAFGKLDVGFEDIKSLTVGVDYLDKLWKPDTFFPNEKKSFFHVATTHNSFLRIEPDGKVFTSQRLTVTATCPMELQLFPMDSQTCKLEIESYGYTTADIDYFWGMKKTDPQESAVAFAEFSLPQFQRAGYRVNITKAKTSSGEYVRLYFEIVLNRNLGFYAMNIIIPSVLIVHISWVSFWLNREASPARVGLGVTTVLTITTVITTTNNSMPKVSYIKGLDVFLNFCFVMVFASLVEYAVVSYMNKKLGMRREKRRKRAEQQAQQPTEIPMFTNYVPLSPSHDNSYTYRPPGIPGQVLNNNATVNVPANIPGNAMTPDCDCRYGKGDNISSSVSDINTVSAPVTVNTRTTNTIAYARKLLKLPGRAIPLMQYSQMPQDGSFRPMQVPYTKRRRKTKCWRWVSPSKIDKCSRYMFPVIFFTFNIGYWAIMKALSTWSAKQDYVAFK